MLNCDICRGDNQVRHITNIYTIGSEGTRLCNNCCIQVSNYINNMTNIAQGIRIELHKQYKKLRGI